MDRDKLAKRLKDRGVKLPCHRCGSVEFTVIDGFTNFPVQSELSSNIIIGGPSVPVALVACNYCGAITPHALGPLGLLPKQEKSDG